MSQNLKEIPFLVSARAARLIGRENVANAEGAIIELIKNTYDADADFCILLFDLKYNKVPTTISEKEFSDFGFYDEDIINEFYKKNESGEYEIVISEEEEDYELLNNFFKKIGSIYIIDNGHGMDDDIIIKYWMTIGTDNKKDIFKTTKGRVKTGAKGIGRFALDRLGSTGLMWTQPEGGNKTFIWEVNWEDFEEKGAVLENVRAKLYEDVNFDIKQFVQEKTSFYQENSFNEMLKDTSFNNGTVIKVNNLRDIWSKNSLNKLYQNLSILIPPKEEKVFNIFLITPHYPSDFGQVEVPSFLDYDYKLEARVEDEIVSITIYRNEFDTSKFIESESFYSNKYIQGKDRYSKETLSKGVFSYKKRISELVPGLKSSGNQSILSKIGDFDFTFYFLKRSLSKKDQKKYKQRKINSSRKLWLERFKGIRLFRDNFRVRPYGEKDTSSFDWLDLGLRSSGTTNQPSKPSWKVRPHMVSGVVNISRLNNIAFEDKSSREGLQENAVFKIFKEILESLISEFERDRYPIMSALAELSREESEVEAAKKEADDIAEKYNRSQSKESNKSKEELEEELNTSNSEKKTLIDAYKATKDEKSELEDENKLLRVLASTGLIVSAFTHELKTIKNNLGDRMKELVLLIQNVVDSEKLAKLPEYLDPYILIEDIKEEDSRLELWLEFAIDSIKKDKRRRKKVEIVNYFKGLERNWKTILEAKNISFNLDTGFWSEIYWTGFTIDLDSIFNNLIVNSTEAFRKAKGIRDRNIIISINRLSEVVEIYYFDSGPGLDEDIADPYIILERHYTTKRNEEGQLIGTGLGMWIVDSVLHEYGGEIVIENSRPNFKVKLTIPVLK